jgi:uncharacterized membrane protein YqiK
MYTLIGLASIIGLALTGWLGFWAIGLVVIGDNEVGVVTKKFGRALQPGQIIALNGEAGIQAETLPPDWHFFFWPWQYTVEKVKAIEVPEGEIALVIAKDGKELPNGRTLADPVDCELFQDARAFMTNGGCKGRQLAKLQTGIYRINTRQFDVITSKNAREFGVNSDALQLLTIGDGTIGVVTVHDGIQLPNGTAIAPVVEEHRAFQDAHMFIKNGGFRGVQEEVIMPGTWVINPWFASVEVVNMTIIPIAHVGVVNSYVGKDGVDLSGSEFKYGDIVENGNKGVWVRPLNPGKYAINPSATVVEIVPTSNFVLNWSERTEGHGLDASLASISIRSRDGFTFKLEVQQIIHVQYDVAPRLIARFGSMANLVQNVLEPLIGNYFRNAGQACDMLEFISERAERQKSAREHVSNVLRTYNVEGVDTLIGNIDPPAALMQTLQDRKIAQETQKTIAQKMETENTRAEQERASANADNQRALLMAEQNVTIEERQASAASARAEGLANVARKEAEGRADASKTIAEANVAVKTSEGKAELEFANNKAEAVTVLATAEAFSIKAVGEATANALKLQVDAVGRDAYTAVEVSKSILEAAGRGAKFVPDVLINGNGDGGDMSPLGAAMQVIAAGQLRNGLQPLKSDAPVSSVASSSVASSSVASSTDDLKA